MHRTLRALLLLVPVAAAGMLGVVLPATPVSAAITIDGPDVSSYQHPNGASINWAAVAKAGHEFAIVKATEGTSYVNKYFGADYSGIRKAGMVRGSYHFARPSHPVVASALAQAKFYVAHIGATNTTKTLPPALDLEQTGGLSRVDLITWAQNFLLDVRNLTGRTPMLYTYPYFWSTTLGDPSAFSRYPLWMATYHGSVDAGATLWQYTAGATVSGIKGRVDMSKLLADPTTFAQLSDGTTPTPWPASAPGVPASVHVAPGVSSASVTWRPADAGTSPLSSYVVTVARADGSDAPRTITMSNYHVSTVITGLSPTVPYAVTVVARNAVGTGTPSSAKTVVPQYPTAASMSAPAIVRYGQAAPVTALFVRADNHTPLANARVNIAMRPHGGSTWTSYGSLVTDATGHVARTFVPRRNDDIRFSYSGATGFAPASVIKTVLVRPIVAAHLSAASVRVNHSVVMSGSVTPGVAGVRVVSEVYRAGHWKVLQVGRTGANGGFRFVLTPRLRGTATYRVVLAATSRLAGFSSGLVLRAV